MFDVSMSDVPHPAFRPVLDLMGRSWNAAGAEVRHYRVRSRAIVRACDGELLVDGPLSSRTPVTLRVALLRDVLDLVPIWEARRNGWYEIRTEGFWKGAHDVVQLPDESTWAPLSDFPGLTSKETLRPSKYTQGEAREVALRSARAVTERFAHVANLNHRGDPRIAASATFGEVYAESGGLRVIASRSTITIARGEGLGSPFVAHDLPGLAMLLRLEAGDPRSAP